ncbi:unnamed protein product [Allacma fusca]|uniref:Uncharacterized protein n=1 Tax=Allacma fusca TaxID=39272 RepID=A0A8J2KGZ7_9HEXA|nr:unnamed protein product [Allacma fusca]
MAKVMKVIDPSLYTKLMTLNQNLQTDIQNTETIDIDSGNKSESNLTPINDVSRELLESSRPVDSKRFIISCLAKNQQNKADKILTFLMQSPDFHWLPSFEVKYKSQLIPKSNICDLVSFVTQSNTLIPTLPPEGIKSFYNILQELNVPKFLYKRKTLEQIPPTRVIENEAYSEKFWKTYSPNAIVDNTKRKRKSKSPHNKSYKLVKRNKKRSQSKPIHHKRSN